eukprot:SAG25_NODE_13115_length_271_cov_0.604651_1_plen_62_part_01
MAGSRLAARKGSSVSAPARRRMTVPVTERESKLEDPVTFLEAQARAQLQRKGDVKTPPSGEK